MPSFGPSCATCASIFLRARGQRENAVSVTHDRLMASAGPSPVPPAFEVKREGENPPLIDWDVSIGK